MKLIPKFSVTMKLCDILYLSYLVPASRIRPFVPEILPMAYIDDRVFISIVIFHSSGVRLVNLPSLRFDYNQINLRTYVKDPQTKNHGFYGSLQKLQRFEIKHSHIQPRSCEVLNISFPLLTTSGLLRKREIHQPINIPLASQGQFHVFFPPRLMKS